MAIKAKLTNEQFITLFGDNEYVRDFSDEAIGVILGRISDAQEEQAEPFEVDWIGFFKEALELDAEDVYQDYKGQMHEHADSIIKMARESKFNVEIDEMLNNKGQLSNTDLLAETLPHLERYGAFEDHASLIFAKHNDILDLKNGGFIKFP